MQNYGGYYQQYPQGQNNMYQGSGQNNMNQSNMRNMFGAPQNYGMPQMPQAPQQQYGYQQQQQIPQQNFVFHFDINNTPSNMNMNMGPYAPTTPQQYGGPPYGGMQMQQNDTQKKEDKNSELFDAFDPFNPKKRTQSKPRTQPQLIAQPQQPAAPQQPQIQMIEDNVPKKQDLNAFRSAFASLAGPTQQPQPQPQQQQQQQYNMQPGQMYAGNMQPPTAPQIEGFNFAGGIQGTQPPQMDGFNFGSQQQQQNPSFTNQLSPQQVQPAPQGAQSQPQTNSNAAHEDIFANFNPISPSQPAAPKQDQKADFSSGFTPENQTNNTNQFGSSDAFSFNQHPASGNIQSFNHPQTGSNGGIFSFDQPQPATTDPIQSFPQPQTGSGGNFTSFGQQQAGSTGGAPISQPQAGSGGGFTPFGQQQQPGPTGGILSFNVPQASTVDPISSFNPPQTGSGNLQSPFSVPQSGSTGGLPLNAIDDLFGSPPSKSNQQQQNTQQQQPAAATTSNPFLLNVNADSNPFLPAKKQNKENPSHLAQSTDIIAPEQQQQQQNSANFNPFGPPQNQIQAQNQAKPASSTSFANSFRQAIEDPQPQSQPQPQPQPQQLTTPEPQKPKEEESTDFHNIFNQGHNFFEKQEQQFKTEQQQHESFTFGSQAAPGDSGAPNLSNFTFNNSPSQPESAQNAQFGNFGTNESQQQAAPFTPFGVSDLQPMPNSTFVISGSGDSVSSQPIAVSADPVDKEKIPYFAEQEKKMEFENRIKNDTMSVFDPFNPNPQPIQPQQQNEVQQQPPQPQQQQHKSQDELKLSATVNASVDTIRNLFGGPSEQSEEKEEEKPQEAETKQEVSQPNNDNQNIFLGGFSSGFGSENTDSQSKPSDIQLNVGMGEENKEASQTNEFDNPFTQGGGFQENFGRSPEANSFGFGGFGFNNSFGKGNVFQHAFEQTNNDKPATFADFFPQHNSQPLNAPVNIDQLNDEKKETETKETTGANIQQPPKSETPFAIPGFDLMMDITNPKQGENDKQQQSQDNPFIFDNKKQKLDFNNPFGAPENEQQKQKEEPNSQQKQEDNLFDFSNQQKKNDFNPFGQPEAEQKQQQQQQQPEKQEKKEEKNDQAQKQVDFDNPFINQSNLTLFGQTAPQNQSKESFNPFGSGQLETAPQSSSATPFTSTDVFTSQAEIPKQKEETKPAPRKESKKKESGKKAADIFDEIPSDLSEIEKTLPEKPPPFIMPTIGDSSSNPFTSVLASSSTTSNPFTASSGTNNANPFVSSSSSPSANPFTSALSSSETKNSNSNNNNASPFVSSSSSPSANPFTSALNSSETKSNKEENKTETSNPFTFDSNKKEDNESEEKTKKGNNDFDDLIGFGFGFSSQNSENQQQQQQQQSEKTQSTDNPFLASFGAQSSQELETKKEETKEDKKEEKEETTKEEDTKAPDTSGFTFASAATTTDTNDANPFSKGFNPFGGDFSNPFASSISNATTTTTNDSQNGGFTFTPSFGAEEEKGKEENQANESETKPTPETNEATTNTPTATTATTDDTNKPETKEAANITGSNLNIVDTLDDDLFDMNSIEKYEPKQQNKKSDLFDDIHTVPVSNSTSDFLEMKHKKEAKNSNVGQSVLMMSDGGVGSKTGNSPLINNNTNNNAIISILDPYQNTLSEELAFSASSEGEDPEVTKVMSDQNPMSKILKKFVKPPENDFYGSFEKDPHPIRIFPKFEDTKAAKVLADFVSNQFGITATFASTSKKQKEEIDMNSIFNAPAASEPNDDDDFLLII